MPNTVTNMNITPLATPSSVLNFLNKPQVSASGEFRKVYVGKIPPGISDHFIIRLLEVITLILFYSHVVRFLIGKEVLIKMENLEDLDFVNTKQ